MSRERNKALPDDLRALGLMVAVHNDYRLNDVLHTFWLMTLPNEDGTSLAFKGEGVNDAEALDQIREHVKRHLNLEGLSPAPSDIGVGDTFRFMHKNMPPTLFPCGCQGELKTTRTPCPNCIRVNYPSADQLRRATQLEGVPNEDKAGPPPTHLAPMVRLSDPPRASTPLELELAHVPRFEQPLPRPWPDVKVAREPSDLVRLAVGDLRFDLDFVQACKLVEDIAAALPAIRWGEGNGPHPGEVVLAQSHPGSRRAAVRPVEGGIALRAVECDGQPAGGSIFLRGEAVDALIVALNAARGVTIHEGPALSASSMQALSVQLQQPPAVFWQTYGVNMLCGESLPGVRVEASNTSWRVTFEGVVMAEGADHDEVIKAGLQAIRAIEIRRADPQLAELVDAGLTDFLPAVLTARRCSASHLQLLDEGVVTANWWPSTGKARAEGPTGGVAAPTKIRTVPELVAWLKGL